MWDRFKILVGPFYDHFRTPYANEICFSTPNNFPWNGTYYFVSSIRKTPYQPLFWIKKWQKHIFDSFKQSDLFWSPKYKYIYFWICSHIQKITLDLILFFLITVYNTIHRFGATQASSDSFWATQLICLREKYTRCDYTNFLCPKLPKNAQTSKYVFEHF